MLFKGKKEQDIFVNGEMQITLRKMCGVMGIKLPREFKTVADNVCNDIVLMDDAVKKGSIYIILHDRVNGLLERSIKKATKKGASAIFVGKNEFKTCGLNSSDYPCIFMEDKINQVGGFLNHIKSYYGPKTITITGTVGKTTTNKLFTELVKPSYNTYNSKGNLNSFMSTASHILTKLDKDTEMYVQEMGAGTPGWVRKNARMLMPDGLILLNVQPHHLNTYKTIECLFEDKTSPDDYLSEDGIVVANFDDELLAKHKFKHRVVSFGINTEREVDYRAINIIQNKEKLEFDIVCKTGETEHIVIDILGKHNAYNATAAYAMARQLGIDSARLKNRFRNYRSEGIRQNFVNIGGNYVYVDCYNACESSIISTVKAMEAFDVDKGKKKIGIVGGENKLGETAAEVHYRIGEQLKDSDVTELLLFGTDKTDTSSIDRFGDAYSMKRGLNDNGFTRVNVATSVEEVYNYLKPRVELGDLIFFKGVMWLDMSMVIDKLYGTSFTYTTSYYRDNSKPIEEDIYSGHIHNDFGECELLSLKEDVEVLNIPDSIEGYPLYRIVQKAFENNDNITDVNFGSSVKNIGEKAFSGCSKLEQIEIPSCVMVVEEGAFRKCTLLKKVMVNEGVTHIGRKAFAECSLLEQVYIPKTVLNIEDDAFIKCDNVTVYCSKGSFAEGYAKMNGIPVEYFGE